MRGFAGCRCRMFALLFCLGALQAQPAVSMDAEKRADIQELMREIGTLSLVDRAIELALPRVIGNLKKVNPSIPDAAWQEFSAIGRDEFKKSIPDIEEPLITIYDANFTAQEIKQLVVFYGSPLGRKVVAQMPSIIKQSMELGQAWGERVGARVADRIRAAAKQKGYAL